MKLLELKNEDALDLLADIIDPISRITSDKLFLETYKSGDKVRAIKILIKAHKSDIIEILAISEGVPVEEYECNILTLPSILMDILNSEEFSSLFPSSGQTEEEEQLTFESVSANTEEGEV